MIATLCSGNLGHNLTYLAHIDTVPPGDLSGWRVEPFGGSEYDGRVYGRGAGDDKSSVTAQIMALICLARSGVQLEWALQVAVVSGEESNGLASTRWLRESGKLSPNFLLVGEQTYNRVAVGERVACGIDLTVWGKSAHGAMPLEGDNAIVKMAGMIRWLEEKLPRAWADKEHPYLPPPTLNIGKISGGEQWNIVPRKCKIEMDRQLLPGETRAEAMNEIEEALDEYHQVVEEINYELFTTGDVASNINTSPDDPFVKRAHQALINLTGEHRSLTGYLQTCDGRWFADDGIPIIIFGSSNPNVAHSPDENVEIDQLIEATRFLALLAIRPVGI